MEFLKAYLRVPAAMIVWVMETFITNRARLARFMARPGVARAFKVLVVVTFLAWLAIAFLIADEEAGRRLNEAIKQYAPQTQDWELLE